MKKIFLLLISVTLFSSCRFLKDFYDELEYLSDKMTMQSGHWYFVNRTDSTILVDRVETDFTGKIRRYWKHSIEKDAIYDIYFSQRDMTQEIIAWADLLQILDAGRQPGYLDQIDINIYSQDSVLLRTWSIDRSYDWSQEEGRNIFDETQWLFNYVDDQRCEWYFEITPEDLGQ